MLDAKENLLALTMFQNTHRRQIWSTNPSNRTTIEITRRIEVLGMFSNPETLLRLVGSAQIHERFLLCAHHGPAHRATTASKKAR